MTQATGFLRIEYMDADSMDECREVVAAARPTIVKLAKKHCDGSVKEFHRQYESGKFGRIEDMEVMRDVINRLLSGYGSQIASVAGSFANNPRIRRETVMDYDDWFQEACFAFSEAIYSYDGSTKFNTHALTVVSNSLKDRLKYFRSAKRTADVVRDSELGSGENGEAVSLESLIPDHRDTGEATESEHDPRILRMVIESLKLSPMEREVLACAADGERGWQTRLAKKWVNPKTLKPYTKANISFTFQKLCRKIRDTYYAFANEQRVAA